MINLQNTDDIIGTSIEYKSIATIIHNAILNKTLVEDLLEMRLDFVPKVKLS